MTAPRLSPSIGSRPAWVALGMVAGLVLAVALGPALAPRPARAVDDAEPDRTISVAAPGPSRSSRTSPTSTSASSSSARR